MKAKTNAEEGSRTLTPLRALVPETSASANSATSAHTKVSIPISHYKCKSDENNCSDSGKWVRQRSY